MSDDSFFREVDEELRSEKVQNFWKAYGTYLIAGAVLFVAAVAGWRYYEFSTAQQAAQSGDAFIEAVRLAQNSKRDEALAALETIEGQSDNTYRVLARMRTAAELVEKGDHAAAVAAYDEVISDGGADENLKAIARIRAGFILVDTAGVSEVQGRVGALAAPDNPWRSSAREALGLAYFKAGDMNNAFQQFEAVYDDVESPATIKQRMRIMMDIIAAQGGPVKASS
ncbi:MAG: tetratricopeptide repeat protein [Ahrensia sp.]|nr:tetratricopeptide repeat protein [Ahrensia sp.]